MAGGYSVSVWLPPTTISFTKFALTLTFVNFSFRFPEDTLVGGDKETGHFVLVFRLSISNLILLYQAEDLRKVQIMMLWQNNR